MYLPEEVKKVISMLEEAGFEAYAVGGCVRDSLLGKTPGDYDVTTSAKPEEMKEVFKNEHVIETGIKHGTLTVLINKIPIETTTFRVDIDYSDNRHPSRVEFTRSLREDLARRDFTVNALAYSEKTGIIDVFGGIPDLEHGIIRCVGNPDERFGEDALRIMRGLRFASVLGFEIEKETADSIERNGSLLKNVSAERLSSELIKFLCGKNAPELLVEHVGTISVLIPELAVLKGFEQHHFRHDRDVLGHTAAVLANVPPKPVLRLAALFHDIAKPRCFSIGEDGIGHFYGHPILGAEMAEDILTRLKFDNETKKSVCELVRRHGDKFPAEPKAIKRLLGKIDKKAFDDLICLMRADDLGKRAEYFPGEDFFESYRKIAADIIEKEECFSLKNLAVSGADLIKAGVEPGPEMGRILDELLEKVIEGEQPNEKEALMELLKKR
ncbi:MAG: HD domain-containing protein [Oscillospiraceae bacterium]|nr:HD domain-containing protein [Oscillospiraceae bacterium]